MRRAVEVRVSLVEKQNVPPEGSRKTKKVNDREILYKVEKSGGGPGGEQYFFAAYESVPGGYVQFSQAG